MEMKCKKAKWLSGEALQIAVKRREMQSKGEKERYKHLNAEFQRIASKFGLGVQNKAGQRLTMFCQENTLLIANTLFQQHRRRLYTWTSPGGQLWNQIDYILCSQRWRSSIQKTKTRLGADCDSDHELLITKFRHKSKKVGKTIQVWSKSNPLWLYSGSEKYI